MAKHIRLPKVDSNNPKFRSKTTDPIKAFQESCLRPRPKYGYCHTCPNTKLKDLKTCDGDPEGWRHDSICPQCQTVYGCTKACQSVLRVGPKERRKRDRAWRAEQLKKLNQQLVGKNRLDASGNDLYAPKFSRVIEAARIDLDWPTMNDRGRDSLDFHEVGVLRMRGLLRKAYEAGIRDAYDSLTRRRKE